MEHPMLPEAKVTILVETFNGVDVITLPLAVKPEVATAKTFDLKGYPTHEHHFAFNCYALYDINENAVASQTLHRGVTTDNMILQMARDILLKRREQPEVPVHTTNINVVRGTE